MAGAFSRTLCQVSPARLKRRGGCTATKVQLPNGIELPKQAPLQSACLKANNCRARILMLVAWCCIWVDVHYYAFPLVDHSSRLKPVCVRLFRRSRKHGLALQAFNGVGPQRNRRSRLLDQNTSGRLTGRGLFPASFEAWCRFGQTFWPSCARLFPAGATLLNEQGRGKIPPVRGQSCGGTVYDGI